MTFNTNFFYYLFYKFIKRYECVKFKSSYKTYYIIIVEKLKDNVCYNIDFASYICKIKSKKIRRHEYILSEFLILLT